MKIALAYPGCHRRAGVERIVYESARFLAGRGHEVTVYASEWEESGSVNPNGPPIHFEYVASIAHPAFRRAPTFLSECTRRMGAGRGVLGTFGCECPTGGVYWAAGVHRAWLERVKTSRAPMSLARWKQRLNPIHPVLLRLEEMHLARRQYRKIVARTAEVKEDLSRCYGVPGEDVEVIPNGFSPDEFNPRQRALRREAMRERLGLREGEVAMLFVANELERKGYRTILAAMRELNCPRLRLLVVGRPDARIVRAQAAAFGVEGRVLACGPTADVADFHAAADFFVLPAKYEAFGLGILEALGSGLPVLTTNIPGADNAVAPGVNGFLIDDPDSGAQLAEAITRLLDDGAREALAARVPATVMRYQWPVVLARYERILYGNSN